MYGVLRHRPSLLFFLKSHTRRIMTSVAFMRAAASLRARDWYRPLNEFDAPTQEFVVGNRLLGPPYQNTIKANTLDAAEFLIFDIGFKPISISA